MVQVLEERRFPVSRLSLLASVRSAGTRIRFKEKHHIVRELTSASFDGVDVALFSAGGSISREYAPIAVNAGSVVIDNSSAWRMTRGVPLVVPEANSHALGRHKGIIANPNCSTIQLIVALKPLHDAFGIARIVVSTYQAISGAGQAGVDQLMAELKGRVPDKPRFNRPAAFNTLFHSFLDGQPDTDEEVKMIRETRKILEIPHLSICATCVRIPTIAAHGESVNVEFENEVSPSQARRVLGKAPGITVVDDPKTDRYPSVRDGGGQDSVLVGRIRRDPGRERTLNLWIVGDNVRKGAATNAVQIAEELIRRDGL